MKAGKTNGLAIGEGKRLAGLGDIPTIGETVPGYEFSAWIGLYAPAKTPPEIIAKLSKAVSDLLEDPSVKDYFTKQFITASYKNPDQLGAYVKSELVKWDEVVKKAGITVQQ